MTTTRAIGSLTSADIGKRVNVVGVEMRGLRLSGIHHMAPGERTELTWQYDEGGMAHGALCAASGKCAIIEGVEDFKVRAYTQKSPVSPEIAAYLPTEMLVPLDGEADS